MVKKLFGFTMYLMLVGTWVSHSARAENLVLDEIDNRVQEYLNYLSDRGEDYVVDEVFYCRDIKIKKAGFKILGSYEDVNEANVAVVVARSAKGSRDISFLLGSLDGVSIDSWLRVDKTSTKEGFVFKGRDKYDGEHSIKISKGEFSLPHATSLRFDRNEKNKLYLRHVGSLNGQNGKWLKYFDYVSYCELRPEQVFPTPYFAPAVLTSK